MQGVQLCILVVDDDSQIRKSYPNNPDDVIDHFLIDHDLPVGKSSPRQNYTGVYDYVTVDLSITARCVGNFQGSDCTQCLPGFAGVECEANIDDLSAGSTGPLHLREISDTIVEEVTKVIAI